MKRVNTDGKIKEITKIIARMVYGIQGSDPNQPKMVGLKEASMTLKESLQQAYKKGREEEREKISNICESMGYGRNGEDHPVTKQILEQLKNTK